MTAAAEGLDVEAGFLTTGRVGGLLRLEPAPADRVAEPEMGFDVAVDDDEVLAVDEVVVVAGRRAPVAVVLVVVLVAGRRGGTVSLAVVDVLFGGILRRAGDADDGDDTDTLEVFLGEEGVAVREPSAAAPTAIAASAAAAAISLASLDWDMAA